MSNTGGGWKMTPGMMPDWFYCLLSAKVSEWAITEVRPADFPDRSNRAACACVLAINEMVYHPEHLRYSLKRAGKRGEGKWQRISWDERLTASPPQPVGP